MSDYTRDEYEAALKVVSSVISRCEKVQPKFVAGTAQHTLLKNRLQALYISKFLLSEDKDIGQYTKEDLVEAIRPISSIISKCEKAQQKFSQGTPHYVRFENMINAMAVSKTLIMGKIDKKV